MLVVQAACAIIGACRAALMWLVQQGQALSALVMILCLRVRCACYQPGWLSSHTFEVQHSSTNQLILLLLPLHRSAQRTMFQPPPLTVASVFKTFKDIAK